MHKFQCDRMAADTAFELKKYNVASISIWPGAVETETMLESAYAAGVCINFNCIFLSERQINIFILSISFVGCLKIMVKQNRPNIQVVLLLI